VGPSGPEYPVDWRERSVQRGVFRVEHLVDAGRHQRPIVFALLLHGQHLPALRAEELPVDVRDVVFAAAALAAAGMNFC